MITLTQKQYFEDGIWIWKTQETRYNKITIELDDIRRVDEAEDKTAIIFTTYGECFDDLTDKYADIMTAWEGFKKGCIC